MARGREFQIVGAATAKLREPKHQYYCVLVTDCLPICNISCSIHCPFSPHKDVMMGVLAQSKHTSRSVFRLQNCGPKSLRSCSAEYLKHAQGRPERSVHAHSCAECVLTSCEARQRDVDFSGLCNAQCTPPTPTRWNCRVASRRRCVHEFATSWQQFRRVVGVNTPVSSRDPLAAEL